ncbi:hypothetical protein [uncultured Mitsuokella sp.]|uniref:hypothetical protein n=1 Tax=uncultured Mitsuokella sp. TaxID=453120 RepID=UPI0025D79347|nr:hypothetical protein [uncultured Mitsuokella sp.]
MTLANYILKKWYIIIIVALLVSIGLYLEKRTVAPTIPQSGEMVYTSIVKVGSNIDKNHEVYLEDNSKTTKNNNNNIINEVTIVPIIQTWGNEKKFIDLIHNKYDFLKLNRNWNNLSKNEDKFKWINDHFIVNYMGNNVYEFVLLFKAEDVKDSQYVKENGTDLLNDYIAYAKEASSLVYPNADFNVVENHQFIDEGVIANQQALAKKYAVIGFVLGALASIAVLCVCYLKTNK